MTANSFSSPRFFSVWVKLILLVSFITFFSISCKKDNFLSELHTVNLTEVEQNFFDLNYASNNNPYLLQTGSPRSKQEVIQSIHDTVLAQNQQYHFVSDLAHILGFPIWNKSKVLANDDMVEDYMVVTPFTKLTDSTVTGFLLATKRLPARWSFVLVDRASLELLASGAASNPSDSIQDVNNAFFAAQIQNFDRIIFGVERPLIYSSLVHPKNSPNFKMAVDRDEAVCYEATSFSICVGAFTNEGGAADRDCPPNSYGSTFPYNEIVPCPGGNTGGGGGTGGSAIGVLYSGVTPKIDNVPQANVASAAYFAGAVVTDNGGDGGPAGAKATTESHIGNEGKPVQPTKAEITGAEWLQTILIRGEGASAQQIPMNSARFTDMRCGEKNVVVSSTDARIGGEKIDIFGTPR